MVLGGVSAFAPSSESANAADTETTSSPTEGYLCAEDWLAQPPR